MVSSLCQNDFVFETLTSNPNRLAALDVMLFYYVGAVVQDIPENTNKRLKTELFRNSRNPLTSAILFQVELSSQIQQLSAALRNQQQLVISKSILKVKCNHPLDPLVCCRRKSDWLNQVLLLKNSYYCSQRDYLPSDQWGQILLIIHITPGSTVKLLVRNPPAPTFSTVFKAARLQCFFPSPLVHQPSEVLR